MKATAFQYESVVTAASELDIASFPHLEGRYEACILEVVPGYADMANFSIYLKDHPDGEWYVFLSGADFDNPDLGNLLFVTTVGPHEATIDAPGHAHFRLNGAWGMKFTCTAAAAGTVSVRGALIPRS